MCGDVFGALTLMLIVNLLLVFNVPTYYSTVVEGGLLILAVSSGLLGRSAPIWSQVAWLRLKMSARRAPTLLSGRAVAKYVSGTGVRADDSLPANPVGRWLAIHSQTLRFVLPAYAALLVALVVTAAMFGARISPWTYTNSLLVLSSFFAVLALGQGAVVISGGLDLCRLPRLSPSRASCSPLSRTGRTRAPGWGVPAVLLFGALAGLINGIGIVAIGIFPLIMTLAMNGIVAGIALVYSSGTPHGVAPPAVSWLMTGHLAGLRRRRLRSRRVRRFRDVSSQPDRLRARVESRRQWPRGGVLRGRFGGISPDPNLRPERCLFGSRGDHAGRVFGPGFQ